VAASPKSEPWWVLWNCVCPWTSMHQKCSNYALTNLLFGLCRSVWIIDLLVTLPSPHPIILTCPSTPPPKVLWTREHAPTPYPSSVFTFRFVVQSTKEFGGTSFAMSSWRRTQLGWRSNMHLMIWINVSHPPLVTTPNWSKTNVFQRQHEIEGLNNGFYVDTTFSPCQWSKLHLKVWSWLKSEPPQGHDQLDMECDFINMKTKLKQLWESIHKIFWVKIVSKVFKNHLKRITYK
jgi:hypothetical protein